MPIINRAPITMQGVAVHKKSHKAFLYVQFSDYPKNMLAMSPINPLRGKICGHSAAYDMHAFEDIYKMFPDMTSIQYTKRLMENN